jgi:hypothetical protein
LKLATDRDRLGINALFLAHYRDAAVIDAREKALDFSVAGCAGTARSGKSQFRRTFDG